MTTTIIIQIFSIVMLMLFAVPGTQWIWNFGHRAMFKREKKIEMKLIMKPGLFSELFKIAAAIF